MRTPTEWLEYQVKELGLKWKNIPEGRVLVDKDENELALQLCKLDGTLPHNAICPGWALYEYELKDGLQIFYENVS